MRISAHDAIARRKNNPRWEWHAGPSDRLTQNPHHASSRVLTGYADLVPAYTGPKLLRRDPVFAMGSCFAREIESTLVERGANVTSIDYRLTDRPEFHDANGEVRHSFFHRFTPRAIWQEFMIAFNRMKGWDPDKSLLFETSEGAVVDLNYWNVEGSDLSLEANLVRRAIARKLVARALKAKVVILTLGLTEGWIHKPTGFYVNRFKPQALRRGEQFEFERQDYADVMKSLLQTYRLLSAGKRKRDFELVLTVSPVPLQQTFTGDDVLVANMDSKATLRAAARGFADQYPNVHYFPSYEMVLYSKPELAWRPDFMHVNRGMVDYIVSRFIEAYYAPGELRPAKPGLKTSDDDA